MKIKTLLLVLSVMIANSAHGNENVATFFNMYIEKDRAFDPTIGEFYSDSAVITIRRVQGGVDKGSIQLSGAQLKSILPGAMPVAKKDNDRNLYSDIKFEEFEGKFKILANRYSEKKCYLDKNYYMVVKPSKEGGFIIVEESAVSVSETNC